MYGQQNIKMTYRCSVVMYCVLLLVFHVALFVCQVKVMGHYEQEDNVYNVLQYQVFLCLSLHC